MASLRTHSQSPERSKGEEVWLCTHAAGAAVLVYPISKLDSVATLHVYSMPAGYSTCLQQATIADVNAIKDSPVFV